MSTQIKTRPVLDSIQALRSIAFLGIFTYHCGLTPMGPWSVSVFFIISGFCLYISSAEKADLGHTLSGDILVSLHRIAKLYPVHIVTMLIVLFREFSASIFSSPLRIICDTLLLTSWFPPATGITPFNGVAWYLSTLLFLYCCFGTIQMHLKRFTATQAWILMLATYAAQILTLYLLFWFSPLSEKTLSWFSYECPLFRLGDFTLGCCLGVVYTKRKNQSDTSVFKASLLEAATALFVLLTLLIYALNLGPWGTDVFRRSVLLTPCAVLTVYLFARKQGIFTSFLSNQPFLSLAKLSPAAFLIHQIVIFQVKLAVFGPDPWASVTQKAVVCFVSFVITCLLSVVATRLFQRKSSRH